MVISFQEGKCLHDICNILTWHLILLHDMYISVSSSNWEYECESNDGSLHGEKLDPKPTHFSGLRCDVCVWVVFTISFDSCIFKWGSPKGVQYRTVFAQQILVQQYMYLLLSFTNTVFANKILIIVSINVHVLCLTDTRQLIMTMFEEFNLVILFIISGLPVTTWK